MTADRPLEIIPLGGLGEFGMNLMVYRFGDDCIVVDAGMMFPGAEHLGVDVVIPNLTFLDDCGRIHGVILTHGHEDHIGALPFLLARREAPVWGTPYTLGLAEARLREHEPSLDRLLRPFPDTGPPLQLGPFRVEWMPVTHSIPQSVLLVLGTPVGTIVHTADFKLDTATFCGWGTDLASLARLGERGVLALLADSTNADRPGFTPGEHTLEPELEAQIASARGRVFATTFASNVQRLQTLCDVAARHGRRVAWVGASMERHTEVAERLDLIRIPAGLRVSPEGAMELPPERALFLVTGSQGEPLSALARIAVDKHREVAASPGDRVLHSARTIPGNERSIGRMVNHLLRRGAEVVSELDAPIHVSGHPAADELRLLLDLLRPAFLIPMHGEYRQLQAHAKLGRAWGLAQESVVLADSGDVIALTDRTCRVVGRVPVGQVFIDASLEEVDFQMLRDRKQLAGDGLVIPVVAIDRDGASSPGAIEIVTRGFAHEGEGNGLAQEARQVVHQLLAEATAEERTDEGLLEARLHAELRRFIRRRTQRRPLIIPVILEL